MVYQVVSLKGGRRLRVRVPVPEDDAAVDSLTPLWKGANFLEREVWDLFGIRFIDHPDLRRVLLYEEFQGHPLRKDYPVNLWQPRVPERQVEGTFVDERSQNKLLRLETGAGKQGLIGWVAETMKADAQELPLEMMELQMGPSHPATHGTIKFNLKLEGEKVLDCDVEVGFLHRGFDKSCEQGDLDAGDSVYGPA